MADATRDQFRVTWVKTKNFQPLRSTNFATVGAKFVFLDFLESEALQAEKKTIAFHIYLRTIRGRK